MMDALAKGKIDAVSIFNPTMKKLALQLGDRGVVFYDETIYSDNVCVSAPQEFTKKHPEKIKKVLKALIKAVAFIKEKPDESRRLMTEFLKIDKAVVDETLSVMDFRVSLEQSLLVRLEEQTRWAMKNRFTGCKEKPNYLDYIYFDGLQSVKPEAVSIIR
jgi:NitT/TauT family transport system substrate-binding protein